MFAIAKARLATALVALAALITAITAPGWHREHADHAEGPHAAHANVICATTHHACGQVHTTVFADAGANLAPAGVDAPTSQDRDDSTISLRRHSHHVPHSNHFPHSPHSDDDGCAICLAINLPTGDGLPMPLVSRATSLLLERLITPLAETPIVAFLPVLWTCGPPASITTIMCA